MDVTYLIWYFTNLTYEGLKQNNCKHGPGNAMTLVTLD